MFGAITDDKECKRSVENLLSLASKGTNSSEAAALVLLSSYNSHQFKLPIVELCMLDASYYLDALKVITGRYIGKEPHDYIEDGEKKFAELWEDWKHLRCDIDQTA